MDQIILPEQKGFIKGRYILDAIINLWECTDYASELSLDFLFLKIDFDKAYDRVEWDFILQSLHDVGLGKKFINYTHMLLGNASSIVAFNGSLSQPIQLKRSIRQGCPLAPLLFVIVADSLGWLVQQSMAQGKIQGIPITPINKEFCLQ